MTPLATVVWHHSGWLPLVLVGAALAAAGVLHLYRDPGRAPDGAHRRMLLPALRLMAIAALAVAVLQPGIMRLRTPAEHGAIVIVVDRSHSMTACDTARSPAALVALADGLGQLPAGHGRRDQRIAKLRSAVDGLEPLRRAVLSAISDLDYARLSGQREAAAEQRLHQAVGDFSAQWQAVRSQAAAAAPAPVTALADWTSLPTAEDRDAWRRDVPRRIRRAQFAVLTVQRQSDARLYRDDASVRSACDQLAGRSRIELVQQALGRSPNDLLSRIDPEIAVYAWTIGDGPRPLVPPGALLADASRSLPALHIASDAPCSDLTGDLRAVLDAMRDVPLQAVILFSDGRQVNRRPPDRQPAPLPAPPSEPPSAVEALDSGSVPIFTVAAAPSAALRDVSIVRLRAPARVQVGQRALITARIAASGYNAASVQVTATATAQSSPYQRRPDQQQPQQQRQQITLAEGRPIDLAFPFTFTHAGVVRVAVNVAELPHEASTQNNLRVQPLNVVDGAATTPAAQARPFSPPEPFADDEVDELGNLHADTELLRSIAQATGGEFVPIEECDSLPDRLAAARARQEQTIEQPLWNSAYLYFFVLGSLGLEWAIRKRAGMP